MEGGNEENIIFWEEYGINVLVPKDAIPSSVTSCDITVVPVIKGSFMFPPDTTPVSAIYAIDTTCELNKQIGIRIQHSVELTDPSHCGQLSFAKAECVNCSPPYKFEKVEGGLFNVGSEYGLLYCSSFSFLTVIQNKIKSLPFRTINRYKLLTFYEYQPKFSIVHFAVTKNCNCLIQVYIFYF